MALVYAENTTKSSVVGGCCVGRLETSLTLADSEGIEPNARSRNHRIQALLVPPAGIEPATPGLGNLCSIH